MLYIDDVLATELPPAWSIRKEDLNDVYRSDIHEFIGESLTRVTWLLFLFGKPVPFTAEYERRSQKGTLEIDGKPVHEWTCEDPLDLNDQ